jgi:predicted small lipoprotein YifL
MNKKTWYAIFMGVLIFISACGKDKKGFMFFPPDAIKDSNGVPLPGV